MVDVFYMLLFFKQKTAYEMRISDLSSDVCSSDLTALTTQSACMNMPQGDRSRGSNSSSAASGSADGSASGSAMPSTSIGACPSSAGAPSAADGVRQSVVWGKSVSVRVDLGGRRIIKKKNE